MSAMGDARVVRTAAIGSLSEAGKSRCKYSGPAMAVDGVGSLYFI